APQTFTITITAVNDAPVANAQAVATTEDTAMPITLAASDVDGDALTYSVVIGPAHGTLSGTPPAVTYTPAANYNGPDSFTFKANDGTLDSNVATVSITVTAINLTATLSAPKQVRLTWSDGATTPSGYTLQRATNSGFTAGLTSFTIAVGTTTFTDTTVAVRTMYFYRVRATNTSPTRRRQVLLATRRSPTPRRFSCSATRRAS